MGQTILTTINTQQQDIEKVKKDIEEIINKLTKIFSSNNINFSKTRFAKLTNLFETLNSRLLNIDELYLYSEASDLIDTLNHFNSANYPNDFLDKLKKTISGPRFLSEENKTTARDYFFELKIATRFKKSNFQVNFNNKSDLQVLFNKNIYNIECKRPQNEKKIQERLNDAYKQLNRNSSKKTGIIALDFSKIFYNEITPSLNLIFETSKDIDKIRNLFDDHYCKAVDKMAHNFINELYFIICHVRFPCIILNPYQIVIVNHFCTINSKNMSHEFKEQLRNQNFSN